MEKQFDFIAIGDTTTDAFIKLKEARVNCDINEEKCQLCVSFGDKIPYEFVEVVSAVGNSANAAVAASRLGLSSALVSNLGEDDVGRTSIASLKENDVDTRFVSVHSGMKSNYHYVLWYEKERTILVKHQAYPYKLPDIGEPKWIYLSSLSETSLPYHEEISRYLSAHPKVKLAFQPGTFQMKLGTTNLQNIYRRTEILFCNIDEAGRILKTKEKNVGRLFKGIQELGPKIISITDGPRGAYLYDGKEMYFIEAYPTLKDAYERTGAGDAFASTVTAAMILGKSLVEAFSWGPINSGSVVQYVGAQKGLLSREKIEQYLKEAPKEYRLVKVF